MAQSITAYKDDLGKLHETEVEADLANAREELYAALTTDNQARQQAKLVMAFIQDWPMTTKVYLDEILRIREIT